MAEVKLKKKICLKRKEKPAEFVFTKYLKIKLLWKTKTDLDLCIFFTTKDGQAGGVFSSMFRQKKSDMGSLEEFPYMEHTGDKAEPSEGGESVEQINIAKLDDIDTAYICIVNYGAAIEGDDVTYADEGGRVEIQSDSGDYLEVPADSKDEGHVYCVCSINNNNGEFALKNESRVMSLDEAYKQIPGFSLIVDE